MKMAAVRELDSLYFHYKHLLFSGCKAALKLNCENGRASVALTTELDVMNNYDVVKKQKQRSPSYFRRLDRRKEERNLANQKDQEAAKAIKSNDGTNLNATNSSSSVTPAEEAEDYISESSCESSMDASVSAEKAGSDDDKLQKAADSSRNGVDAEKQSEERRWLCILHGCIGEEFSSYEEIECDCCGVDTGCKVVVYTSDEEYDDSEDPT